MMRRCASRCYTSVRVDNKIFLQDSTAQKVSYWHHPSHSDDNLQTVNCVVEIPNTFAKRQVEKRESFHPITQDDRVVWERQDQSRRPRFYQQSVLFNYGFIPQTYESPLEFDKRAVGYVGDDDPLDVVEISPLLCLLGKQGVPGLAGKTQGYTPFRAAVLGSFCLIDQGETDWKVILLEKDLADLLGIRSVGDLAELAPGYLRYVMSFFKNSKRMEGKGMNHIEFDERVFGLDETRQIIQDFHLEYKSFLVDSKYQQLREKYLTG